MPNSPAASYRADGERLFLTASSCASASARWRRAAVSDSVTVSRLNVARQKTARHEFKLTVKRADDRFAVGRGQNGTNRQYDRNDPTRLRNPDFRRCFRPVILSKHFVQRSEHDAADEADKRDRL